MPFRAQRTKLSFVSDNFQPKGIVLKSNKAGSALYEIFVSLYTRCSYRLMRDIRSARIEMSVTVGISILSNVGETLYPMRERLLIQVWINTLSNTGETHYPSRTIRRKV